MQKYTAADIQVLNAIDCIRRRPDMYIGGDGPLGPRLVERLIGDIALLGALPAHVAQDGAWWLVTAEKDWLRSASGELSTERFFRVVHFPECGLNGFHAEGLLTAFADAVVTAADARLTWIAGDDRATPLPGAVRAALETPGPGRHLAFRMTPDQRTPMP